MDTYPIDKIRDEFPALQRIENDSFVAYFDGPGSTQVARGVIDAMTTYMKTGVANPGGVYKTTRETAMILSSARDHVASLVGSTKESIVFGPNMSTLAYKIARTLGAKWDDETKNIVVTELDHNANVEPWATVAKEKGLHINVLEVKPKTKTLDLADINKLINDNSVLVAISMASNVFGTINDIAPIIKRANEVGALIALDGVHAIPHYLIDFEELAVDFLFGSAHKFFGPHIGFVAIKEDTLMPTEESIFSNINLELETGAINYEGLVGVSEAIKFIASIGSGNVLREQLTDAFTKIVSYERVLAARLRKGLAEIEHVTVIQAGATVEKTPTVAFQVEGLEAKMVCYYLAQKESIHLEYGDFNSASLLDKLELADIHFVRIGIVLYNTIEEIDRLIEGVKQLR